MHMFLANSGGRCPPAHEHRSVEPNCVFTLTRLAQGDFKRLVFSCVFLPAPFFTTRVFASLWRHSSQTLMRFFRHHAICTRVTISGECAPSAANNAKRVRIERTRRKTQNARLSTLTVLLRVGSILWWTPSTSTYPTTKSSA